MIDDPREDVLRALAAQQDPGAVAAAPEAQPGATAASADTPQSLPPDPRALLGAWLAQRYSATAVPTDAGVRAQIQQQAALGGAGRLARNAQAWAAFPVTHTAPGLEAESPEELAASKPETAINAGATARKEATDREAYAAELAQYVQAGQDAAYRTQMVHNAATMQARADAGGKDPSPEAVQAYEQKFAAVPRAVLQGMTGEGAQLATAGAGAAEKAGAGAASAATAQRTATLTPAEVEKIRAEAAQIPLKGAADIANLRAQAAEAYARARAAGPEAQAKVMASLVELDKQLQERGAPSIFPGAGTGPGKHDVPGGQLVGAPLPPEEETRLRSGQNAVQNIERVENAPQNPKSTIKDMGLGAAAARMTQGKLPFFGEVKLGNTQDLKDLEDQTEAERAQMREWFKNVRPGGGTDEEAAAYSNMLPMPTGTDLVGGNKERFLKRRQDAIDRFKAEIRQGSSGRYKFSEPEQGGTVRMKGPKGTFDVPAGKVDKFKANGYQVGG